MDASRDNYSLQLPNDFELHDFIDNPNFDQFIDLIRGENEDSVAGFDYDLINGCFIDTSSTHSYNKQQLVSSTAAADDHGFGSFDDASTMVPDPNYIFNALSSFDGGEMKKDGGEDMDDYDEDDEDDNSSGTTTATKTTTTTSTKKGKVDRSRTLISERRRRGRMKEKLYALRALVPNITKMDKASIIGDAVLYVQELQMQAKKLKAEIAGLEASLSGSELRHQESVDNNVKVIRVARNTHPICKTIKQLDMFQVEEREFYIRLVCNKGEGVAVSLYKALESLSTFKVQNSNLTTLSERFVLTFTLNVRDCEQAMNLPNLKLWVTGALLNQGFEFITPFSS